jgi:hypothetical protein
MAADKGALIAWLKAKADLVVTNVSDRADLEDRFAVASRLDAAHFAAETIDIAKVIGQSCRTPSLYRDLADLSAIDDAETVKAASVLSAIALSLSVGRIAWVSRPSARRARQMLIDMADSAYAVTSGLGPDLHSWLIALSGVAIRLISEISADMTPVVTVQSGVSLPSTVLAYRLYGDARRASGLVDLAGAGTPFIMPVEFEALAS